MPSGPLLALALGTLLSLQPTPKDDPAAKEAKTLQGTWKVVALEVDGKAIPAEQGPRELVFKGDELLGLAPNAKFKLDPTQKPKHLDLINKNDPKKIFPLIYELKDDELRIAVPLVERGKGAEAKRPTSFTGNKEAPIVVLKAKREKK